MYFVWSLIVLNNFLFFIKCEIPTLSVWSVDSRIIEKKRQDTLELCKLFNEDNNIIQTANEESKYHNRAKRAVPDGFMNPMLNNEDINRIEGIVDRIYDEMEENGERVNYRRRNLENLTRTKDIKNKTYRRFNFAPALILGPNKHLAGVTDKVHGSPPRIPWLKKWPFGIIPYFIDPNTYDSYLAEIIVKAFDYVEKMTCIRMQRLREKPTDKLSLESVEWLYISNPFGIKQCVHSNDQKPNVGVQMIVLGYDCLSKGEIAHEVMHVLGFWHEHTRPDRDQYITIHWENIKPGYKKYFEARTYDPLESIPYDYSSVLHYPPRAFSKNGQATISVASGIKIGQRDGLSEVDVEKVGIIFGSDCTKRNEDYLLKTCPSVIKSNKETKYASISTIRKYFENRVWAYGIVNYKIRDKIEFSTEERENIKAVMKHIEKETCIEFKDANEDEEEEEKDEILDVEITPNNTTETPITENTDIDDTIGDETVTDITVTDNKMTDITITDRTITDNTVTDTTESENHKLTYTVHNYNHTTLEPKDNEVENYESDGTDNLRVKRRHYTPKVNKGKVLNKKVGAKRRHAENILVLARSTKPGCECPKPGRPNGNKMLYINSDCFNSVNDLLHLFVHILGLEHQHNMHDRDSFLHIAWDKLTPELKKELRTKLPPAAAVGFAYDYQSVMHFPWLQIKNGVTNIMYPIWNDGWAMGHWQGLSSTDVQKINFIYAQECQKRRNETNSQ